MPDGRWWRFAVLSRQTCRRLRPRLRATRQTVHLIFPRQAILQRRWAEVQRCLSSNANLAATVMMDGLLESLFLARINGSPDKPGVFTTPAAPRDKAGKTLALSEWKLVRMVDVAHELTWVTKSAKDVGNVLRDFRNYIHPHREYTDGVVILEEDARMFWEVIKSISRHVFASVGKSP